MPHFTVDQTKCLRCGACAAECPLRVISQATKDDHPAPSQDFALYCIRCGHCVAVCPTAAFSLDWLKPEDCAPVQPELALAPEQAEQFLCARRSIRTFKDKPVERELLDRLLDVACRAASARNYQPWNWVVTPGPAETRRLEGLVLEWMRGLREANLPPAEKRRIERSIELAENGRSSFLRGAPHLVTIHAEAAWPYAMEDSALALGHLDLMARTVGLGTCWAGIFYSAANAYPPLQAALGLPQGHKFTGAMMVGYPKFAYPRMPRRNPPATRWLGD